MVESVQFDLRGENHLDFDDIAVTHVLTDNSAFYLKRRLYGRLIARNIPMPYHEIEWIGAIRRRQWWLLISAILFTPLCCIWLVGYFGQWDAFLASVVAFLLLVASPLILFIRGRYFLGIVSPTYIIYLPLDRKKRKIARILGLLAQVCPPTQAQWELRGTAFADPASYDNAPLRNRPFRLARFRIITAIISAFGVSNYFWEQPKTRDMALPAAAAVVIAGAVWAWSGRTEDDA